MSQATRIRVNPFYGHPFAKFQDKRMVLIINLDRRLSKEQARRWRSFYEQLHDVKWYYAAIYDAYCPSQIRRDRSVFREPWKPLAVYALCPRGMQEEKKGMLLPLALEQWKIGFLLEDVCWQESREDSAREANR